MDEKAEESDEINVFRASIVRNLQIVLIFLTLMENYTDKIASNKNRLRWIDEEVSIWIRKFTTESILRWALEVSITRSVDAFDHYLSLILLKVFTKRPDIFRASEYKADVRDFIEAGSVPEFIKRFAEKRVNELSYMGLPKLMEYLNNRLGLGFDIKTSSFQTACEMIEVRNILAHNAGRVNKLFLQRTGRTDLHEGDLYPLAYDYIAKNFSELTNVASELDIRITSHFKLNQEQ